LENLVGYSFSGDSNDDVTNPCSENRVATTPPDNPMDFFKNN
jgi:hypothetical protein